MQDETGEHGVEEEVEAEVEEETEHQVLDSDVPTGGPPPPVTAGEGVQHDTNPTHYVDETYSQYQDRIRATTHLEPASDAEWANAELVEGGPPETDEATVEEEHEDEVEEDEIEEDDDETEDDSG